MYKLSIMTIDLNLNTASARKLSLLLVNHQLALPPLFPPSVSRIPEAVLIIMVTTACVFIAGTFLGTCYSNKHIDERERLCPELFVRRLIILYRSIADGYVIEVKLS